MQIQRRIEEKCKGEFESSFLASLLHWIDAELSGWLLLIFQTQGTISFSVSSRKLTILAPNGLIMFSTGPLIVGGGGGEMEVRGVYVQKTYKV